MRQIVFVIDNVHTNSGTKWTESQRIIAIINEEIKFYKNLSFRIINIDTEPTTRTELSVVGITKFPFLRVFEDGKIIDNWFIKEGLREHHWDSWSDKWGIKYSLAELDELRKSEELRRLEEERKRIEDLNNENKKLEEKAANENRAAQSSKNIILIIAGLLAAFYLIKK